MSLAQVQQITLQQLSLGKAFNDIERMAVQAGIGEDSFRQAVGGLLHQKNFPYIDSAREYLKEEYAEEVTEVIPTDITWDPLGETLNKELFLKTQAEDNQLYDHYQKHPHEIKFWLTIFFILGAVGVTVVFWLAVQSNSEDFPGEIILLPALPFILYWNKIRSLQRRLFKQVLTREKNWTFAPGDLPGNVVVTRLIELLTLSKKHKKFGNALPNRWPTFKAMFPRIFDKGNCGQKIYDEIWGSVPYKEKSQDFYSCIFQYTKKSGSGKNRRSRTYHRTIFAFRLDQPVSAHFLLFPESQRFLGIGKKRDIDTESEAFNKAFAFEYNGKKDDRALEIMKTLSPAVQVKLLELLQKEGKFSVGFEGDVILYAVDGLLIKKMKTDFVHKVALHPKDKEYLENRIQNVLDSVSELIPYLR